MNISVFYELYMKLLIFNKTLIATMKAVNHISYIFSVLTEVCTAVMWLTCSFHEYMHALAAMR